MKIDGKRIAETLLNTLKAERKKIKKKIGLTVFLINNSPDQLSFVRMKSKIAKKLNINYKLIHLKSVPNFISFANMIKKESAEKTATGIIIQQPLPAQLATESLYDYIPLDKEIEGHKNKSFYSPPISQALFTLVKYIYGAKKVSKNLFINLGKEAAFFKKVLKNKKIVLVGRGITGGKPIGKTMSYLKINYINVNSKTIDPENYYKNADLIITSVGKKVIEAGMLKPGVILINIGLRRENSKLQGDYDVKEIEDIASFYTPTPGGIGLIDVAYLYKNLIEAAKLQK